MSNKKAWFKAAKTGDINQLKTLLETDNTLIKEKDKDDYDYTAFMLAVCHNQLETVKFFCENDKDESKKILKDRNQYGYTALLVAAFHGRLEIVRYLLETYTSLNPPLIKDKNDASQTAFMVAIERGQTAIFEYLLEFSQRHRDYTDLMVEIIRKNDPATVQWLLDNGADVNAQDADGCTVMHHIFASCARFPLTALPVYQCLKSKQPDMAIKNKEGKTAYQIKGYDPQILPLNEPTRGLIAHVNHDACFTPNAKYISAPSSRKMHENGIWWHEFVLMMIKDRRAVPVDTTKSKLNAYILKPDNYIKVTCSAFLHFQLAPDVDAIKKYSPGMHYFVDVDSRTVFYCILSKQDATVKIIVDIKQSNEFPEFVDFEIYQSRFLALFPEFTEYEQLEKAFIENQFPDKNKYTIEEQWKQGIAITAGAVQALGLLMVGDPASYNRLAFLALEAQEGKCMRKLQDIYESLVDLPDDLHSKMSAIITLHEGIGVCPTGLGGRISRISKDLMALKISSQCMDDLLYLYRENIVKALHFIDKDDIHTNNHVATLAAIGFGTKAQEPGDRGGIGSDKKTRALFASFREGFRYYSSKNGLMTLLREAAEKAGYTGKKAMKCWPIYFVDEIIFDEHQKVASSYNGSYIYTERSTQYGNFVYIALSGEVTNFYGFIEKSTLMEICRVIDEQTVEMPAKLEDREKIIKTTQESELRLINADEHYSNEDFKMILAMFNGLFGGTLLMLGNSGWSEIPEKFIFGHIFCKNNDKIEVFYYNKFENNGRPLKLELEQESVIRNEREIPFISLLRRRSRMTALEKKNKPENIEVLGVISYMFLRLEKQARLAKFDTFLLETFEKSSEKPKIIQLSDNEFNELTSLTSHSSLFGLFDPKITVQRTLLDGYWQESIEKFYIQEVKWDLVEKELELAIEKQLFTCRFDTIAVNDNIVFKLPEAHQEDDIFDFFKNHYLSVEQFTYFYWAYFEKISPKQQIHSIKNRLLHYYTAKEYTDNTKVIIEFLIENGASLQAVTALRESISAEDANVLIKFDKQLGYRDFEQIPYLNDRKRAHQQHEPHHKTENTAYTLPSKIYYWWLEEKTPLMVAISHGNSELVEDYLKQGANVNIANTYGWTALHELALFSCKDEKLALAILDQLLAYGANPLAQLNEKHDKHDHTPSDMTGSLNNPVRKKLLQLELNHAIQEGNMKKFDRVMYKGADLNVKSSPQIKSNYKTDRALLHEAESHYKTVKYSLQKELDVLLQDDRNVDVELNELFRLQLLADNSILTAFEVPHFFQPAERLIATILQAVLQQYAVYSFEAAFNQKMPAEWIWRIERIMELAGLSNSVAINQDTLTKIVTAIHMEYRSNAINIRMTLYTDDGELVGEDEALEDALLPTELRICQSKQHYLLIAPVEKCYTPREQHIELSRALQFQGGVLELLCESQMKANFGDNLALVSENDIKDFYEDEKKRLSSIYHFTGFIHALNTIFSDQMLADNTGLTWAMRILQRLAQFEDSPKRFYPFQQHYLKTLHDMIRQTLLARSAEIERLQDDEPLHALEKLIIQKEAEIKQSEEDLADNQRKIAEQQQGLAQKISKEAQVRAKFESDKNTLKAKMCAVESALLEKEQQYKVLKEQYDNADAHATGAQVAHLDNEAAIAKLRDEAALLQEKQRQVAAVFVTLQGEAGKLKAEAECLQVDQKRLEEDKNKAEKKRKASNAVLTFVKAIQTVMRSEAFTLDKQKQCREKIASLRESGHYNLRELYDFLVRDLALQGIESADVQAEIDKAGDYFHACLDAIDELVKEPNKLTDIDNGTFKYHGFNLSWQACYNALRDAIKNQLNRDGLELNNNGHVVVKEGSTPLISQLPEALRTLMGRHLKHLEAPDHNPEGLSTAVPTWNILKTEDAAVAKTCIERFQLTLPKIIHCFVQKVELIAGNHIWVDANIDLPGVDITLYAQQHIILKPNCNIKTSGDDAPEHADLPNHKKKKARNGAAYCGKYDKPQGQNGVPGLYGLPGMSAGHIALKANGKIVNLETLTCEAKGGKGGAGQEGGDGDKGKEGGNTQDAVPDDGPTSRDKSGWANLGSSFSRQYTNKTQNISKDESSSGNSWMNLAEPRIQGVDQYGNKDSSDPLRSGPGGNGGKPGLGGGGGWPGDITIEDVHQEIYAGKDRDVTDELKRRFIATVGQAGDDGLAISKGGEAGEVGYLGCSVFKTKRLKIKKSFGGLSHSHQWVTEPPRTGNYDIEKYKKRFAGKYNQSSWSKNYSHQYSSPWYTDKLETLPNKRQSTDERSRGEEGESCRKNLGKLSRGELPRQEATKHPNEYLQAAHKTSLQQKADRLANLHYKLVKNIEQSITEKKRSLDQAIQTLNQQLGEVNEGVATKTKQIGDAEQAINQKADEKQLLEQKIAEVATAIAEKETWGGVIAETVLASLAEVSHIANALSQAELAMQCAQVDIDTIRAVENKLKQAQARLETLLSDQQEQLTQGMDELLAAKHGLEALITAQRTLCEQLKNDHARKSDEQTYLAKRQETLHETIATLADEIIHHETVTEQFEHAVAVDAPLLQDANRVLLTELDITYNDIPIPESIEAINTLPASGVLEVIEEETLVTEDFVQDPIFAVIEQKACDGKYAECVIELRILVNTFADEENGYHILQQHLSQLSLKNTDWLKLLAQLDALHDRLLMSIIIDEIDILALNKLESVHFIGEIGRANQSEEDVVIEQIIGFTLEKWQKQWVIVKKTMGHVKEWEKLQATTRKMLQMIYAGSNGLSPETQLHFLKNFNGILLTFDGVKNSEDYLRECEQLSAEFLQETKKALSVKVNLGEVAAETFYASVLEKIRVSGLHATLHNNPQFFQQYLLCLEQAFNTNIDWSALEKIVNQLKNVVSQSSNTNDIQLWYAFLNSIDTVIDAHYVQSIHAQIETCKSVLGEEQSTRQKIDEHLKHYVGYFQTNHEKKLLVQLLLRKMINNGHSFDDINQIKTVDGLIQVLNVDGLKTLSSLSLFSVTPEFKTLREELNKKEAGDCKKIFAEWSKLLQCCIHGIRDQGQEGNIWTPEFIQSFINDSMQLCEHIFFDAIEDQTIMYRCAQCLEDLPQLPESINAQSIEKWAVFLQASAYRVDFYRNVDLLVERFEEKSHYQSRVDVMDKLESEELPRFRTLMKVLCLTGEGDRHKLMTDILEAFSVEKIQKNAQESLTAVRNVLDNTQKIIFPEPANNESGALSQLRACFDQIKQSTTSAQVRQHFTALYFQLLMQDIDLADLKIFAQEMLAWQETHVRVDFYRNSIFVVLTQLIFSKIEEQHKDNPDAGVFMDSLRSLQALSATQPRNTLHACVLLNNGVNTEAIQTIINAGYHTDENLADLFCHRLEKIQAEENPSDDDKSAITFLLALLPFSVNCAAIFQATLSALQKDHAKKELKPILVPVMLHLQTTLCEQAINSWITHPIFSLRLQQFMKGLTESYLDISAEEDKEAVIRELNRMYTFITTTDRSNIKSDFDFIRTYCEQNPEDHEFFINNILSDTELLFASRLDKPVVLEILYNNPSTQWQSLLKKHYWENKVCTPLFDGFLKSDTTAFEDAPINDKLEELAKTDSCSRAKLITAQLQERISALPDEDHSVFKQSFGKDLETVSRCKKQLASSHAIAVAENEEALWLMLMDRVLYDHHKGLSLDHVNMMLHVAQFFPSLSMVNDALTGKNGDHALHALLFQFVCLAAEKNVIFEEKTALNLHVLNDTVFSTDNGLTLLEALGKALYFGSNQAIQTMTATQFNALIQQCMDVKVYHDPALVNDLSTRLIYYWDAVLKRRQLALQLSLKRENKTHQAILESLLTLQKEVDKKVFEQWIHHIQKNISEKTDDVYKQISVVFGFFASCEWTMDDAAFQVIANEPVYEWETRLSTHFKQRHEAEDSNSKTQRSVADLVQIMRADTSGINGCGHVLMLPDQGTMPAKIDENTIIFERKDRAITFFWQEAGGIVQKSVDEIVVNDIITALPRSGESTDQTLFQKITLFCGRTRINDGFNALFNPQEGELSLEAIIEKAEEQFENYKKAPKSKEEIIEFVKSHFNVKTRKGQGPHEFLRNGGKGDDGQWTELIVFLGLMMYAYHLSQKNNREIRYTQLVALIGFIHGFDTSKGRLANISTGQGKTLITQMLAIACALRGDQPDVITSSKVLAEPNAKEAEDFLSYFGLTVGCNCDKAAEDSEDVRRERYAKHDVIYGDIGSFQRDKLLTVGLGKAIRPNTSRCLIIDEVDSLLIDNADKVLYISHAINDFEHLRETFLFIWQAVHAKDTHAYSENHVEMIVELYQRELKEKTLDALEDPKTQHLIPYVDQHLRDWIRSAYQAKSMITNERQYSLMEKQGEQRVVINDLPTGVEQMNSRWSNGLHAFLELKHRQMVSKETLRAVYDSNVSYVNTYAESGQLFGMTGTLGKKPERDLLSSIYHGVKFFSVPRFRREKYTQTKAVVCGTMDAEWKNAILASVTDQKNNKRASLLICEDKKSAEILRKFLEDNVEKSCRIRSYVSAQEKFEKKFETNAEPGDIIIATNIAGRGTDLELNLELKANGGLHVILTYVPSNIRIEEQAFGRAARSDEAGSGQFIVQDARANNMHTVSIEQLRDERDEFERIRLMDIQQVKVPALVFSQRLLRLFLDLQADITKKLEGKHETWIALQQKSLQDSWAFWRDAYELSIKQIHQGGEAEILAAFEHWKTSQLSLFDSNEDKLVTTSGELMHLAKFYQHEGQHQSALRCYDNVIKLAPNFCGFAHYYRAQALIRLNSSSENKTAARRSLKKAIESFEKEIARLSTSNQVIRVVGEQRREQGEGLEADVYTKQNIDEMGVINIHIRAAKTALGSDLKNESFESGEALAEDAIIVFNNLRQAMSQDTLKDYRLSGKAIIVQEQSQSVLYYKDQKIQWFGPFKEAEKEIMAYLASKAKTQATDDRKSYSDRRVDLNDLKKFVLTQDKWLTYLKDVLIEKEIFTLPENFTALLSGDSRWKNSIYQGDGPAIRDRLKTYTPPKTKEDFIAAMQVSEDIIAHLIAEKILISQKSYCFKDAARELIKPYLEQPCPVENQLLTALNLHETASYFHRAIEEQIMHCAKKGIFTKEDINLPENDTDPVQHFWADLVNQGVAKNPKVYFPETTDSKRVIKNRLNAVKNEVADKIDAIIAGITKLAPPSEEDKIALHKLYSKERHYLESLINQRQTSSEKPIPLTPQEREKIQEENRRIDNIQRLKEAICNALSDSVGTLRTIDRVKLSNQALKNYFQQGKLPPIVIDYMQNACSDVLSLIEDIQKKNTDWDVFCCVMLGVAQIVAGVLVAPMCPMLGEMLIGEGVGDIMFAVQSHISGEFSWKAYQERKKQSLTTSLMFMGVGAALKSGKTVADGVTAVKAGEEAVKYSVSQEIVKELTKAAIQVAVDVSITMEMSKLAEDIVESIFSDFKEKLSASVKSLAKHEIKRISNSMKTLYEKIGEVKAKQMFQQSLGNLDLQKVMMHHINPKALIAIQAVEKKLSAYKSADAHNGVLRAIGKISDLFSTLRVVDGYVSSVRDIINTSVGLFEQLTTLLDCKVKRCEQTENIHQLSEEEITNLVDAYISEMINIVLQKIQQHVQQIFRAGLQFMSAALESEIDKAKQWLLAGIDSFYQRDEIRAAQKVRVEQMAETPAMDEHHAVLQCKQGELLTIEDLENTAIEEVKQLMEASAGKSLVFTVKDGDLCVVDDEFSRSVFEGETKDAGLFENQSIDLEKDPAKKPKFKTLAKIPLQSKIYTLYQKAQGGRGVVRQKENGNGQFVKKFNRKDLMPNSFEKPSFFTRSGTATLLSVGYKASFEAEAGVRYAQATLKWPDVVQCDLRVFSGANAKGEVAAIMSKPRKVELGVNAQDYFKFLSGQVNCQTKPIDIPIINKTVSLSVSSELFYGIGGHVKASVFRDNRARGNVAVGTAKGWSGSFILNPIDITNTKPASPSQEVSNQRRTNQESVYRNNRSSFFSSFSDYVSRSDQYDQYRTEASVDSCLNPP